VIKPLNKDENLTPNSSGRLSFVSVIAGVAALGQIVHGQLVTPASIVKVALATGLFAKPLATAMAFTSVLAEKVTGPVYRSLGVTKGVLLSVVK
jgi:hypothetical protein